MDKPAQSLKKKLNKAIKERESPQKDWETIADVLTPEGKKNIKRVIS